MQRTPLHSDRSTVSAACTLCRSFSNVLISFHFWIFHHHNSSLLIQNETLPYIHDCSYTHHALHVVSIHVSNTCQGLFQQEKNEKKNWNTKQVTKSKTNVFPVTGNILKLLPSICTAKDTYFSACRWLPTDFLGTQWPKLFPTDLHKSPSGCLGHTDSLESWHQTGKGSTACFMWTWVLAIDCANWCLSPSISKTRKIMLSEPFFP